MRARTRLIVAIVLGAVVGAGLLATPATPLAAMGLTALSQDENGVPLAAPVVSACSDVENRVGDCTAAADPDASCYDFVYPADDSGGACADAWGNENGYKIVKAVIKYYGGPGDNYASWGNVKTRIEHWHAPDDIHPSFDWFTVYDSGTVRVTTAGKCDDDWDHPGGGGGPKGWHGQSVQGYLRKEESQTWHNGACATGPVKGWFGGGVEWKP